MMDFDSLLSKLHSGGNTLIDDEANTPIVVTQRREFVIPEGFDLTIGYAGDVNSQSITFKIPKLHDSHDLSACGFKCLRWKNLTSGIEDLSTLVSKGIENDTQTLEWVIPPAALTEAGVLEISITICDLVDGKIAFSWNTPIFSGFLVGSSQAEVGGRATVFTHYPAKDEVLFIDEDTRSIVAPKGYNPVIANYGDIGTSYVYFQTTRYLRGIDLLDENTQITVVAVLQGQKELYTIERSKITTSFAEGSMGEGLVSFVWEVPEEITNNSFYYMGAFSIAVLFENKSLKWATSAFTKLTVGTTLLYDVENLLRKDVQVIVDGKLWTGAIDQAVGGIVLLRDNNTEDFTIKKNELRVLYDEEGNFKGIAVGMSDGQQMEEAPLVGMNQTAETIAQALSDFFNQHEVFFDSNIEDTEE